MDMFYNRREPYKFDDEPVTKQSTDKYLFISSVCSGSTEQIKLWVILKIKGEN